MADDVVNGRCNEVGATDSESSDGEEFRVGEDVDEDNDEDSDEESDEEAGEEADEEEFDPEEDSDDEDDGKRPASNTTGGIPVTAY